MAISAVRLRSIVGGSAGNLVEWYDWFAYASLAVYFAPSFFPAEDRTLQLLNSAGIFAVGFVMRPVGAWVMGVYSDRRGRKAGLGLSVAMMCVGSLMIALAPGYASVGVLSPALLVIARMVQGFSVGGEYGAGTTYLSEMATQERRGFYASFQYATLIAGQLAALGVLLVMQALLDEAALEAWGWRIPFLIGAVLALAVYLLRRRLAETEAFLALDPDRVPRSSIGLLWREHRRATILAAAITIGSGVAFYTYTTYLQKYLSNTGGFSRQQATAITAAALLVFMAAQPVWGALSDRLGRKPLTLLFGVGGMLVTVPVFAALAKTESAGAAFLLALVPLMVLAPFTAVGPALKAELFPSHVRALGVALPYGVAQALFGGTTEYVALWFKSAGIERGFYWYVTAAIGVALIAFLALARNARATARRSGFRTGALTAWLPGRPGRPGAQVWSSSGRRARDDGDAIRSSNVGSHSRDDDGRSGRRPRSHPR